MARPSLLGTIANFTIGNAITIPITKYVSSFSDTLNIYIGTTWIKRVEGLQNNQSVSFTASEIDTIYAAMPNVTAATFKFINTTYNSSIVEGTSEKTAIGSINDTIKPTIDSISITEAMAGIHEQFGGYVENQSRVVFSTSATAGEGSAIETYYTNIGSHLYTGRSFTSGVLTASGDIPYSVSVIDRRGRIATTEGTISVLEYTSPQIPTFTVVRCDSDGTENIYGTYVKINLSASISAVNNNNTKTFKVEYKKRTDITWTTLSTYNSAYTYTLTNSIHSGFDSDYAYDFKVTATDYFGSSTIAASVSTGFALLDFKANGKGIAIGEVSTKDALEIGLPIYDRFDTTIGNGLAQYGGIDPDTTLEALVLTETNTPTSGFYYVNTLFYSTKSATSNRTQIAYPYAYNAAGQTSSKVFTRIYVSDIGWGAWQPLGMSARSVDYSGVFDVGKLRVETGWTTVTPTANFPTTFTITFASAFKTVPVVTPVVSTGAIGTQVLGCSVNGVTKTSANIVFTRTNTIATGIMYTVVGEI